jgi:BirA family biotin operon repressor/biotin-[acetyl-CoA-carboxylase] ligase
MTAIYDISQEALEMATWRWAKPIQFYEVCDSTNSRAVEWARAGAKDGSIVVTDHQTEGRGRGNRTWFSLPNLGSLLLSVIVKPKIPPEELGLLSLGAGVAVSQALAERKQATRLKWPNDIMMRGRKMGGILCESEIIDGRVAFAVIGIGINMRISRDQFPRELQAVATSCYAETGRSYDRSEVIAGILVHLEPILKDLDAGRTHNILNSYIKVCETLGKNVSAVAGGEKIKGTAIDIDDLGGLVLDTGHVVPVGDVDHLD